MNRVVQWIAGASVAVVAITSAAVAQEILTRKYEPYYQTMFPISQAFGLEMLDARLRVVEAYATTPMNAELKQHVASMATHDLGRFYGTLQQRNAALATELKTVVDAVAKAVLDGQPAAAMATRARPLVANAYNAVIDPALRNNLQFKAALMASMLMAEDGVSEAFEEAVKYPNRQQYPVGWGAWERVEVLWKELAEVATPALRSEATLFMDNMRKFYQTKHLPPVPFPEEDQEELESLTHSMAALLESVADATLFVGRDMPRVTKTLGEVVASICAEYAAGRDSLATERLYATLEHFVSEASGVAGTLSVLAPETDARARLLFSRLLVTRYKPPAGTPATNMSAVDACRGLVTVMAEANKAVGG